MAETVIWLAHEGHARVIVVSVQLQGGLLGSTARALVKSAPCPTLVVRELSNKHPRQGADR